jgi:serine protease inhibitor
MNEFAFRLAGQQPAERNVLLSPSSISTLLELVALGADGETLREFASTLGLDHENAEAQLERLKTMKQALVSADPKVSLHTANAIWARTGIRFNPTYMENAHRAADAEIATLDFKDPAALAAINSWVKEKTEGMIPTLFDRIEDDTVLIAVNAIAFKGQWSEKFDEQLTHDAPFHPLKGDPFDVKMMSRTGKYRVVVSPVATVVEAPYGDKSYSMLLLLPTEGEAPSRVVSGLNYEKLKSLLDSMAEIEIALTMPRWSFAYERTLNDDLKALGIREAFDPSTANLTRMRDERDLYLQRVIHKSFIEVNEEGTRAAAVTGAEVGITSVPAPPKEIRFDRPFAFLIQDTKSGAILFLGWVNDPRK